MAWNPHKARGPHCFSCVLRRVAQGKKDAQVPHPTLSTAQSAQANHRRRIGRSVGLPGKAIQGSGAGQAWPLVGGSRHCIGTPAQVAHALAI